MVGFSGFACASGTSSPSSPALALCLRSDLTSLTSRAPVQRQQQASTEDTRGAWAVRGRVRAKGEHLATFDGR